MTSKPVTISAENMPLIDFMSEVLKDQQLDFSVENKTIFIKIKEPAESKFPSILSQLAAPPVTGIVRGPDGQPLAGVNVVVKGTKKGVVTDVLW